MKKLTYLLAIFAFLAALAGLAVALMGFFERRKELLNDDDYEQELYRGGQEYYAEDFNLDTGDAEESEKETSEEAKENPEQE